MGFLNAWTRTVDSFCGFNNYAGYIKDCWTKFFFKHYYLRFIRSHNHSFSSLGVYLLFTSITDFCLNFFHCISSHSDAQVICISYRICFQCFYPSTKHVITDLIRSIKLDDKVQLIGWAVSSDAKGFYTRIVELDPVAWWLESLANAYLATRPPQSYSVLSSSTEILQ